MKLKKVGALFAASIAAGACIAWAAVKVYEDSSLSSLKLTQDDQSLTIETTETRYLTPYLGGFSKDVLLKVVTNFVYNTAQEGGTAKSTIEARHLKDFFASPLWTVKDEGNRVEYVNEDFIQSKKYGCCGDFDRSALYNVETGKSPATYLDNDLFTISVPNSPAIGNRYLAQIQDTAAPAKKGNADYIGSIAYFDASGVKSLIRFYAEVPAGWGTGIYEVKIINLAGAKSKNEIRDHSLELWDSDGQKDAKTAFKEFGLTGEINFDTKNHKFTVKVKDDAVTAADIETTPGLEFEVLN
jgi:hypothetical protein